MYIEEAGWDLKSIGIKLFTHSSQVGDCSWVGRTRKDCLDRLKLKILDEKQTRTHDRKKRK